MIRVFIADDQPLVRMGLRALITSEPDLELVGEAEDGRAAVQLTESMRPDVVLMDIRMPVLDGLGALREIATNPHLADVHVVILTTFALDEYVFAALEAGAAGFIVKDADPDDIIRAIHAAAAGEGLLSPAITRAVISTFVGKRPAASLGRHPGLDTLTEREREVLELVAEGYNNDELAERLYISKATARTHVGHILSKLGARDRAQLVVIAHRSGMA